MDSSAKTFGNLYSTGYAVACSQWSEFNLKKQADEELKHKKG